MNVAVKYQANNFSVFVHHRGAGVAANDVVVGHKIKGCLRINVGFCFEPRRRQCERQRARMAAVSASKVGERGHRDTVFAPTADPAVRQAKGERGVWIVARAVHRIACLGQSLFLAALRPLHVFFETFSRGPDFGVVRRHKYQQRVAGRGNRAGICGPQCLTKTASGPAAGIRFEIRQTCALDQFCCQLLWALVAQQALDQWVVRTQFFPQPRQTMAELGDFKFFENWRC